MKCTLVMESDDLKTMLIQHFRTLGFQAKELDELVTKFREVFPDGLKVEVDPLVLEAATDTVHVPTVSIGDPNGIGESATTLTYTELMAQNDDDIADLIKESESLKNKPTRKLGKFGPEAD